MNKSGERQRNILENENITHKSRGWIVYELFAVDEQQQQKIAY